MTEEEAQRIRLDEREACAKLMEGYSHEGARFIRARNDGELGAFVERIRKEERKRCIAILEKTKDPTMKDPLWDGALMHAISELETLE